jgi:AcrR family transcriptional regulator
MGVRTFRGGTRRAHYLGHDIDVRFGRFQRRDAASRRSKVFEHDLDHTGSQAISRGRAGYGDFVEGPQQTEVPVELARLWRLTRTPSGKGRPATLDVDDIVRTAVRLADEGGLEAASLPRIAGALGVTTMSLYRHVGSRNELWGLMSDYAAHPVADVDPAAGWRTGLHAWAYALRATYAAHPWLPHVPVSAPPGGPNAIAWMDAFLRALRDTGLDPGRKLALVTLLANYVRSASLMDAALAEGRRAAGQDQAQAEAGYLLAMRALVDPDRYPDAAQVFAAEPFLSEDSVPPSPDADFEAGLATILDGITVAIAASDNGPLTRH